MSSAALRAAAARVLCLSYSQILRLRRCPWAWHARHVRKLVPLRRRRPPPVWGDAYHAAAAEVWRERAEWESHTLSDFVPIPWAPDDHTTAVAQAGALARLRELDEPGVDAEALAAEVAQAAVEACRFVGPEWRVLWLGGEPVVERRLEVPMGEVPNPCAGQSCATCDGDGLAGPGQPCPDCDDGAERATVPVVLVTVLDLALERVTSGVARVVDHKTTTSWPEEVGDALDPQEPLDLDLRDDLQVRLYVLALRHALAEAAGFHGADLRAEAVEGYHLVRRASVGAEPPVMSRGSLSRAKTIEATEEQWRTAIRRAHLREEDYEVEIARARLLRWQAWGRIDFTPRSLAHARREVLWAAEDAARYGALGSGDVPRFHRPSYWRPSRPLKWGGCGPKTGAECHHWDACQACDHRDLCVAELDGDDARAALLRQADFAHAQEERDARSDAGVAPPARTAGGTAVFLLRRGLDARTKGTCY